MRYRMRRHDRTEWGPWKTARSVRVHHAPQVEPGQPKAFGALEVAGKRYSSTSWDWQVEPGGDRARA